MAAVVVALVTTALPAAAAREALPGRPRQAGRGNLDCAQVTCAIVTRRDHWGLFDRGFDVFVPASWS